MYMHAEILFVDIFVVSKLQD